MQMKSQTLEHVNVGILISLDMDRYSHEKFLGSLSSAIYREWEVRQQLAEDRKAQLGRPLSARTC